MSRPHALDGFHVDILNFVHERPVERYLWEVLATLGAPPITGQYTQVSEAFGARGSRYRLFFNSDAAPRLFKSVGRLIDKIIFVGQNYRVYGKGWYSHKKGYQRIDLDIAAKEERTSKPTSPSPRQTGHPSGNSKRTCVESPQPTPWVSVPRQSTSRHAPGSAATARPWTSPNMFDALREHIVVAPAQATNTTDGARKFFPSISPLQTLQWSFPPTCTLVGQSLWGTQSPESKCLWTRFSKSLH
ncbi:hypothetical protein H310_03558 [Aphanomyces invadans]|uniref:Uncharacterized protein n=1 Tax=Aphanomyces invadans TaxID=157072 RepID=A0A024UHP3_9STRA|nr:hypothetical protein H310_03558 [Aphanomyces invadans]ETW05916.1 hypothetical protein H310_03558 [Aphanomyces invadans]|eukprot:XP_008865693.1 hypothetical protein H310_03558 [Aphanomyces invadans]